MKLKTLLILLLALTMGPHVRSQTPKAGKPIRTLIVDGQNNHGQWPKITYMMKQYLEETGLFTVAVDRTHYTWNGDSLIALYKIKGVENTQALAKPRMDSSFHPDFSKYDLVICNFGWNAAPWPTETKADFEQFMSRGGGLVVVHAADNSFPEWPAYNQMIGLGGWGDRTEKDGPYVYYDPQGKLVKDTQAGKAGSHGPPHEYQITVRNPQHPITKGMPLKWMHTKDELYDRLRGPAEHMEVLATAFSSIDNKGTGRSEPALMTISYGKGRVFHTIMGHVDDSASCVGFITTLLRGAEWSATGQVTIPVPADFPTENATSKRSFVKK